MSGLLYKFGPFSLDVTNQRLESAAGEISLRPKVFAVLSHLVRGAGNLVTRDELLDAVWPDSYVDDHTVSVHIREVRLALGDETKQPAYIETRYRRGWIFRAAVETTQAAQPSESVALQLPSSQGTFRVPETRYTSSGELNIAYQVIGEGPVDLVFVMGWVSQVEYFWNEPSFARFLRELSGFSRLIIFDKRGTGLSDRVPVAGLPALEQRMDDLRAVMDAAQSKKAILFGVSEGGPLSTIFAATYPERTLALIMFGSYARRLRAADYPFGVTAEEHESYIARIRREWGGPVGLEERAPSKIHDQAFRDWWATYLRMGASPNAAVALTRMNAQVDVRGVLPAVPVPTLVMHRRGDKCLPIEGGRLIASLIPNAQFVELAGNDHLPFVGDQDRVISEVRAFVSDLEEGASLDRVLATVLAADFATAGNNELAQLNSRIANEVEWYRGHMVRAKPSTLIAAFDGPARAIRCACAIGKHAADLHISFRAGLHIGECSKTASTPVTGPAVEIASFLRERAKSGEILATGTVRDLATGSGLVFADAGTCQLPGFENERQLLRVIAVGRGQAAAGR
ncbi:MAG TPA: alpha/beta fold hydrolase [Bryobacteraceae bacterium]|jgi:pimeloyl-ACP methyl ester carboxylesterase